MDNFSISCMKLLNDYPLYDYAAELPDGSKSISVLLLGSGSRMETLLQQILTCGQMLNTSLDITLVNPKALNNADAFIRKAPAVGQFIRIFKEHEAITKPDAQLGTLHYESAVLAPETIPDILSAHRECSYILISTGNSEQNQVLADACAGFESSQCTLMAYVCDEIAQGHQSSTSQMQVQTLSPKRNASYFAETEQIAFNLHYVYEKSQDSRMPIQQIQEDFRDPYNYVSNIEAAVHVRTKLACCGIDTSDLKSAASSFRKALRDDPTLLERLAAMEHNRWLMSKVLKGYVPMPDVNLIYSTPKVGTHDSNAKWHCCIVPCSTDGSSYLKENDWDIPFSACRDELDPLDKMTLLIHQTCKRISDENRPRIEHMIQTIIDSLTLDGGYSMETVTCVRKLEVALAQLFAEKKSAIPLFRQELDTLLTQIKKEGSAQSFVYTNFIELLGQAAAPLIEYVSQKDYKELDRIMVEQIPYVLSWSPKLILVKTFSKNLSENLYPAWQYDPQCITYIALARNEPDLTGFLAFASQIKRFLDHHNDGTVPEFHLLIPETLMSEILCESEFVIHKIGDLSASNITDVVEIVSMEIGVAVFDITGGDPLLNYAVNLCAEQLNAGVFYLQNGRVYNLYGAEEFEYPGPQKSLTVHEMFDMAGAVLEESEASRLAGSFSSYKALWQIARTTNCWDAFCKDISGAYHAGLRHPFVFFPSRTEHPNVECRVTGAMEATAALVPALKKLEELGCVQRISVANEYGNIQIISYILAENIADPIQLEEFLSRAIAMFRSGTTFSVGWSNGYPSLCVRDLFVKALVFPEERKAEYETILEQLELQNFIVNHRVDRITAQHSFSFASREILTCLQKSGNILERFIYFSATFDGHFDDVELGWKFLHSMNPDSVENEIDVICTKESRSLFISAKMTSAQQLTYGNNLNYIFYEISLLTDRFGTNATPVLVAPALKQFRDNPHSGQRELSNVAKLALRRGVYLIGEECVQQNLLGQTLDRIILGDENWYDF